MVDVRRHLRKRDDGIRVHLAQDAMGNPVLLPAQERKLGKLGRLGGAVKRGGKGLAAKLQAKNEQVRYPEIEKLAEDAEHLAQILEKME